MRKNQKLKKNRRETYVFFEFPKYQTKFSMWKSPFSGVLFLTERDVVFFSHQVVKELTTMELTKIYNTISNKSVYLNFISFFHCT